MPKVLNKETGIIEDVEQNQVGALLGSGAFEPVSSESYEFTNRHGEDVTIPGDSVGTAVQRGFEHRAIAFDGVVNEARSRAQEEVYGGALGIAQTAVEGGLRGATLGLSDIAFEAIGEDASSLRARREVNPTTALVSELTGAIAPSVLSGGTSGFASVARALPSARLTAQAGALGKTIGGLKGALTAGAVEGAVFGAGQGVSNIALSDEPLTAEAAFKEIGINSLYGGALGGAFGAGAAGLAKLGNTVKSSLVKRTAPLLDVASKEGKALQQRLLSHTDDLDDLAERILSKADDRTTTGFRHAVDDDLAEQTFRGLKSQKSEALEYVSGVANGSTTTAITKAASKAEAAEAKIAKMLSGKKGPVDFSRASSLTQSQAGQIGKLYDDFGSAVATLRKESGLPIQATARPVSSQIVQAIDGVGDLAKTARAAQADYLSKLGGKDGKTSLKQLFAKDPEEAFEALRALDRSNKAMADLAEVVGGKEGAKLRTATDGLSETVQSATKESGNSLPAIAEVAAVLGIEEALLPDFDGPLDDILKLYLATRAVGKFSKSGGLAKKALSAVESKIPGGKSADIVRGFVNDSTAHLATAAGNSLNRVQSGLAKSLETGGKILKRSTPATAQVLNSVTFSGAETGGDKTAHEAFKARAQELSAAVSNMPATEQRIHDKLAAVRQTNIGVGDKIAGHARATLEYLHQKMPKDPGVLQSFGVSKWRPTESEMDKWAKYVRAAQDPAGVVERFGNGHITREDAETLRTLYPAHFGKVQTWIMDNLPAIQKNTSYQRRIQMSILMGVAADPIMANVGAWQDSFAQVPQPASPGLAIQNNTQPTTAQQLTGDR